MTLSTNAHPLLIAEIGALREEINQNVQAMANNENFCAGACAALISFAFSRQQITALSISAIVLSFLIYLFGVARFMVLRNHTKTVDDYLRIVELRLRPEGGWVNWYDKKEELGRFPTYAATRLGFWSVLPLVILGSLYFLVRG